MAEVVFFIAGIGAIAGAIGVVAMRNPFFSVLSLVFHLLSLAALFLLLRAQFVAAAQVVVYAGAVMVLYVFVVAYIGDRDTPLGPSGPALSAAAPLFAGALAVELCIAVLGSGLKGIDEEGPALAPGFGSPGQIGQLLLTKFLVAFEVASFLLLVAAVGAVILARRRAGLEGQEPEGGGEQQGEGNEPPGRRADRLVASPHIGDHEHVEDHYGAGVDHDLGRREEFGVQEEEQGGQREQVEDEREDRVERIAQRHDAHRPRDRAGAGDEEEDLRHSPSARNGVRSMGSARSISLVKMRSLRV